MVDKKHENNEKEKQEEVTKDDVSSVEEREADDSPESSDTEEVAEEIIIEEEVEQENTQKDKLKKLQQKLKDLDSEKKDILEELQRTKADALNARKRQEEEKKLAIERANVSFIESLLPLCDSFHMAMGNTEVWEQVDERWRKGVEGIRMQLDAVLDKYQVTKQVPEKENFDPKKHEALSEESVESEADNNKIIQVVQAGYLMHIGEREILVRPARVIVGKYEKEKLPAKNETENK